MSRKNTSPRAPTNERRPERTRPNPSRPSKKPKALSKGIAILGKRDVNIGSIVGGNVVTYNYYSAQDLQQEKIGDLPPSVQFELVDHQEELKQTLAGLKARKAVLVWGIGGVGKTNLAAHAAYRASQWFKDGVIWIQVGQGDILALCDGLARALGDESLPRLPVTEKIDAARRLLAGRHALLVLDDAREQKTLKGIPSLCPPNVGLLVTSRQNVAAFRNRVELKPLPHPQARLLFCQRADLPKSMADDPAVDAICRKWDGYPLGIVLTAGRKTTEGLPLERLAEHLRQVSLPGERPAYLSPDLNEVHTLLEDHFQPLAPAELSLLDLIAANFGKSINLTILAQAVQLSELETETVLGNLVKAALVIPTGGRYSIHDVVRDALLARLPTPELAQTRLQISKGLEQYLTQKLPFEGRWCIAPPAVWRELEPDFENCLGAIRWCLANSHIRLAWNFFRLVDYPLGSLGYWDQEAQICQEIIAQVGDIDLGQTAWWKANVLGFIHWERGESKEAHSLAQEAREAFAALNDPLGMAEVNLLKANIITYELAEAKLKHPKIDGALATQARDLFEQAITAAEVHHDHRILAHALGDFTDYWYFLLERYDVALPYCQRSIEIYTQLGDEESLILAQPPLCDIYIGMGDYAKAEAMLEPMREAARQLGRPDFEPQVDWSEAKLREKQGDAQRARKSKRKALAFYRKGLTAATRCRKAFTKVKLPYEAEVLKAQERRLKSKIRHLKGQLATASK